MDKNVIEMNIGEGFTFIKNGHSGLNIYRYDGNDYSLEFVIKAFENFLLENGYDSRGISQYISKKKKVEDE